MYFVVYFNIYFIYFAWNYLGRSHLYTGNCFDQFCKLLTNSLLTYCLSSLLLDLWTQVWSSSCSFLFLLFSLTHYSFSLLQAASHIIYSLIFSSAVSNLLPKCPMSITFSLLYFLTCRSYICVCFRICYIFFFFTASFSLKLFF